MNRREFLQSILGVIGGAVLALAGVRPARGMPVAMGHGPIIPRLDELSMVVDGVEMVNSGAFIYQPGRLSEHAQFFDGWSIAIDTRYRE